MPRHVEGRRVAPEWKAIEQPGDYFPIYTDGGDIKAICFSMPGFGQWGRISGEADEAPGPKWTITEDDSGAVTVAPSIESKWTWGEEKDERKFHAYLKGGVWELLDDCVGLEL